MTTATVIGSDNFFITPIGLDIISEDVTYEEWAAYGKQLSQRYSAIQWAIGDWINFGERKFGEMYSQAEDDTHFAYGTLRNYASICSRIPAENRSPNLTFHQTKHVACLQPHEQRQIIDSAIAHDLTGDDILEAVQRVKGKKPQHDKLEGWITGYDGKNLLIQIDAPLNSIEWEAGQSVTLRMK